MRHTAIDSRVYDRLARAKRHGESFSKTIDRLLREAGTANTGRQSLRALAELPPLPNGDAAGMRSVVEESRVNEAWEQHDLR